MRAPNFAPKGTSERLDRFAKPADKPKPEIPRELAMAAEGLSNSPAVQHVLMGMHSDALTRMINSAPGVIGEIERTIAHYELTAISNIRMQLDAMVDELKINPLKPEEAKSF